MERVPITFEHQGRKFNGFFSLVAGAGSSSLWHLYSSDKYYLGWLRICWKDQWYFDGSRHGNKLEELAQYFGDYITAWIG